MCGGYQPSKGTNLRYIYVLITNVIAIGNAVSKKLKLFLYRKLHGSRNWKIGYRKRDWYLPEISSVLDNLNGDLFSGFCRPGKSVKI